MKPNTREIAPGSKDGEDPSPQNGSVARLAETAIPKALARAATRLVDSLKINSVVEKARGGRRLVIKSRNGHSEQLAHLSNLYFRVSGIPIRFRAKVGNWRRWEVECFNMLNGDRFRAWTSGEQTVCADKLPGQSLWDHLEQGTLTRRMAEAAGHEFRRAHAFWSKEFRQPWSHGDAGTNNVIYDSKSDRARFIDFEIIHEKSLPTKSRHADDLLVFLVDLIAVAPNPQWLTLSLAFLNAYDNEAVISELEHQLALPSGMAWIWWGVRTSFANPSKVKRRLERLRDLAAHLQHYRAFAAKRVRHRRRASMNCHVTTPGMPSASSRTRAIKASVIAR
jgi:hypothetical protein